MDILRQYTSSMVLVLSVPEQAGLSPETLRAALLAEFAGAETAVSGNYDQHTAQRAELFVSAWADEFLACTPWPGRQAWLQRPLQEKRGRGRSAGLHFFEELDLLQPRSEADRGLARVALRCLALGYAGKYHADPLSLLALRKGLAAKFAQNPKGEAFPPRLEQETLTQAKRVWLSLFCVALCTAALWFVVENSLLSRLAPAEYPSRQTMMQGREPGTAHGPGARKEP